RAEGDRGDVQPQLVDQPGGVGVGLLGHPPVQPLAALPCRKVREYRRNRVLGPVNRNRRRRPYRPAAGGFAVGGGMLTPQIRRGGCALVLVVGGGVSGCGSPPARQAAGQDKASVVVGSFDFPESVLLANIYA